METDPAERKAKEGHSRHAQNQPYGSLQGEPTLVVMLLFLFILSSLLSLYRVLSLTSRHAQNYALMSEFVTEMGRIKHSRETGLRPVNQRRMAKAVRRAIGLGLMSSVHRHPEILAMESDAARR